MEKDKSNEESGILKALESIHLENQNLHHCLKKIAATRRILEAKWESVTSHLSSLVEENYNLQDANFINFGKIEAVEKQINEFEESKMILADTIKKLNDEIKGYKESFETKIDNLVIAADKLSVYFLLAVSNDEATEEEYLIKLAKDYDKMKSKFIEKENNIISIKKELEECDFFDFPENPVELLVQTEERQFVMDIMENNLRTARQHFEDLYKLKIEKEKEESEL